MWGKPRRVCAWYRLSTSSVDDCSYNDVDNPLRALWGTAVNRCGEEMTSLWGCVIRPLRHGFPQLLWIEFV